MKLLFIGPNIPLPYNEVINHLVARGEGKGEGRERSLGGVRYPNQSLTEKNLNRNALENEVKLI